MTDAGLQLPEGKVGEASQFLWFSATDARTFMFYMQSNSKIPPVLPPSTLFQAAWLPQIFPTKIRFLATFS